MNAAAEPPCRIVVTQRHLNGHRAFYVRTLLERLGEDAETILVTGSGEPSTEPFTRHLQAYADRGRLIVREVPSKTHADFLSSIRRAAAELNPDRLVMLDADHLIPGLALSSRYIPASTHLVVMRTPRPTLRTRAGRRALIKASLLGVLALRNPRLTAWFLSDSFGVVERRKGYASLKPMQDPPVKLPLPSQEDARAALGIDQSSRVLGLLGSQSAGKHPDLAFEAARKCDWIILLAGPASPWTIAHAAAAEQAGTRIVRKPGYLSDDSLAQSLAACDAIALTYDLDAPSGFLVTAAAAGIPAIVGESPWLRSVAMAHGLGEVVTHDVDSLVAALSQCEIRNPAQRHVRALAARAILAAPPVAPFESLVDSGQMMSQSG